LERLEALVCVGPGSRHKVVCRELQERIAAELEGRSERPNAYPATSPPEQIELCERCALLNEAEGALARERVQLMGELGAIINQARHWLAWFDEPAGAKTWDLNIVAAGTRALLHRLDERDDRG
jgi:hypothetical protein